MRIPHNLETTPLQIKTDSPAGSGEFVEVQLYTGGGYKAGMVLFNFNSSPQYRIGYCRNYYSKLPNILPRELNKVWQLTKLPGPEVTVRLECNGVRVMNILLSANRCGEGNNWSKYWSREVQEIQFSGRAPDEYRPAQPGN